VIKKFSTILTLGLAVAAPFILRSKYEHELLVMTCIFAILALSLDLIIGYMGQFSFGHQAFFGIGAYTSAILTLRVGLPVWIGFFAGVAAGALGGLIVGYIALRSTRGMALAIITLGFGVIIFLTASHSYILTNGMTGLHMIPVPTIVIPGFFEARIRSEISYYYLALSFLVFVIYFVRRMLQSRFGRALLSLRENEDLASSIGISPLKVYLLTFTVATALAGLSGALYAHHIRFVQPMLLSVQYMIMMVIMVLVGGSGTLGGPIIGAFIFIFVPEHLPVSDEFKRMVFGVILFLSIVFMPQGVYPYLRGIWIRLVEYKTSTGMNKTPEEK
jgi:branched-chain amino acid transport system permease protein